MNAKYYHIAGTTEYGDAVIGQGEINDDLRAAFESLGITDDDTFWKNDYFTKPNGDTLASHCRICLSFSDDVLGLEMKQADPDNLLVERDLLAFVKPMVSRTPQMKDIDDIKERFDEALYQNNYKYTRLSLSR